MVFSVPLQECQVFLENKQGKKKPKQVTQMHQEM